MLVHFLDVVANQYTYIYDSWNSCHISVGSIQYYRIEQDYKTLMISTVYFEWTREWVGDNSFTPSEQFSSYFTVRLSDDDDDDDSGGIGDDDDDIIYCSSISKCSVRFLWCYM